MRIVRASEASEGDFMSVMGAWWEIRRINPTQHDPAKLQFLLEGGRSIILNVDDMVLLLEL